MGYGERRTGNYAIAKLGNAAFSSAWATGAAMTLEQALEEALVDD